ncbi:Manganese/iron superoxide dismutase [Cadophora sp. MPI-SDFR-AT-0126]|nr:Manganese/iron superoxide dismutase [Leotiomycetes sp. MPI-SDFR-AT-0126]
MLRPILPRARFCLKSFRRSLVTVPEINPNFNNGIPGLLSPAGFDIAWTQYQGLMVEKLNNLIAGGDYESKPPKDILIKYARDPNSAPIFNYASMAFNNHFFFEALSPEPTAMPEALQADLEQSFGSIETLKREFVVTASSMFGPGFVWLMKNRAGKYTLLCTYLAGSPFPGAHYRKQSVDMNTEDKSVSEAIRRLQREDPVNTVGAHGQHSQKKLAPGGIDITPVLCINMWEHVYLADYGVGAGGVGGKKAFAESWWHTIDWSKVEERAKPAQGRKPSLLM